MENAGCVTLRDDYLFRSAGSPQVSYERRAEHDPARDGAHVVRRPGHDEVVGRPLAQRVVRRVGRTLAAAEATSATRPGPTSPTPARPGPTARTSCPRRTRSPPTTTTSRPSRSTSTGSPTPRAPRCSSSWSPGSAASEFLAGLRAYFKDLRVRQLEFERPAAAARGDLRARPEGLVGRVAARPPASTPCAPSSSRRRGPLHVVRGRADAHPARLADAAPAPARHRPLRPRRGRAAGPPRPRDRRRRRRAPRCPSCRRSRSPTCCCSTTAT